MANRFDIAPYLLGLDRHAYVDRAMEGYARLHEVARALAADEDGEARALRAAARLAPADQVLAALLVAATRECAERRTGQGPDGWPRLSDEAYFAVARAHGRLGDFLAFWDHFTVPESTGLADALKRHRLLGAHLRGGCGEDEREDVRLAVLALFEATEEQAAVALTFCNNLRGDDAALHDHAAARLLWAAERGELAHYRNEYVDLAARVVAALGRWGVAAAYPHLAQLQHNPPPTFSPLARAHLRRAVQQLASSQQ